VKSNDFGFFQLRIARILVVISVFFTFSHAAEAKSDANKPVSSLAQSQQLILSLPEDEIKSENSGWTLNSDQKAISAENQQFVAGGKKKRPLNLDCGMDVYQNTGPDISITSRLTGECDVKYHY